MTATASPGFPRRSSMAPPMRSESDSEGRWPWGRKGDPEEAYEAAAQGQVYAAEATRVVRLENDVAVPRPGAFGANSYISHLLCAAGIDAPPEPTVDTPGWRKPYRKVSSSRQSENRGIMTVVWFMRHNPVVTYTGIGLVLRVMTYAAGFQYGDSGVAFFAYWLSVVFGALFWISGEVIFMMNAGHAVPGQELIVILSGFFVAVPPPDSWTVS